jgi:hypothetical protein
LVVAVGLAGGLSLAGCGTNLPATAPATGTVLYRGQPVEGVVVLFGRGGRDLAKGELAIGTTDAQGHFELTTHVGPQADVKGAVPGPYEVTLSKAVPPPGISESQYRALVEAATKIGETGAMVPPEQQPPPTVEMFPPRYSVAGKSELKADVTERGPNDFQFKLE